MTDTATLTDTYEGKTVVEVEEFIESNDYNREDLRALKEYEKNHQNRNGAREALEAELDSLEAEDKVESAVVEATDNDPEEVDGMDASNTEEVGDMPDSADRHIVVTINDPDRVSAAGMVFDEPGETKQIRPTPRVEEALEKDRLSVVEE